MPVILFFVVNLLLGVATPAHGSITRFSLGSVDGTLVLAVEEIDLLDHRATINLAPWTGNGWGKNCGSSPTTAANLLPRLNFAV